MRITTSILPAERSPENEVEIAVVIDVLRATSVIAKALSEGAKEVVTCRDVSEARELAARIEPRPLLCGERQCRPIEGFDLGNSPAEYTHQIVADRTLVLTTTNGTRAIDSAAHVPMMCCASFLNLSAVVDQLAGFRFVHLICAGTNERVTAEDVLLAGAIVSRCETRYAAAIGDDATRIARDDFLRAFKNQCIDREQLQACLANSIGGRNLIRAGYEPDLAVCAALDSSDVVPHRSHTLPSTFRILPGP